MLSQHSARKEKKKLVYSPPRAWVEIGVITCQVNALRFISLNRGDYLSGKRVEVYITKSRLSFKCARVIVFSSSVHEPRPFSLVLGAPKFSS